MYDMIREWPRYVTLPFPIAKVTDQIVHRLWQNPMIFMRSFVRQSLSETNLNYEHPKLLGFLFFL